MEAGIIISILYIVICTSNTNQRGDQQKNGTWGTRPTRLVFAVRGTTLRTEIGLSSSGARSATQRASVCIVPLATK